MSEQEAFHAQMAADPNDATTRAVYADWLDEHDQPEAARRLRWWSKVLPHMPDIRESTLHEKPFRGVTLPDWASHLALQHYSRSFGHPNREKEELVALGLIPQGESPVPDTDNLEGWLKAFRRNPNWSWGRAAHIHTAQKIAEHIGEPVKLAAIPPTGSTGSELVRVPVPTPVQTKPKETVAPVAQPSQPTPTKGPTFFLPG